MKLHWTMLLIGAIACDGQIGTPSADPSETEEVTPTTPPTRDPVGDAELPAGRRLRRMSADQFVASLEVATGQRWSDYERFAAAMGRADYGEITEEGLELNVTFEKLVEDAARATCDDAVRADVDGGEVILRHVSIADRDEAAYVANLEYLFLRFLGQPLAEGDTRLDPWLALLNAPPADGAELTDTTMRRRWTAVCVGLVTHPDFVSY